MIKKQKWNKKLVSLITILFLVTILLGGSIGYILASGPSYDTYYGSGGQTEVSSFIIWKDESTYYSKSGTTGQIEYESTDGSDLINEVIDSLDASGDFIQKITIVGNIILDSAIDIGSLDGEVELEINGRLTFNSGSAWAILYIHNCSNIVISGGGYGELYEGGGTIDNAILIVGCTQVTIKGLKMNDGIDIRDSDTVKIFDNEVSRKGIGLNYATIRSEVKNNILLDIYLGNAITISGGSGAGWGNSIIANFVQNVTTYLGITIDQGSYRNIVSENIVIDCVDGDAINAEDECYENQFTNNKIYQGRLAVTSTYGLTEAQHNIVTGNLIVSSPADAIYLLNAKWNVVEGNLVYNSQGKGIALLNATNNLVHDNMIKDTIAEQYAIYLDSESTLNSIKANNVEQNTLKIENNADATNEFEHNLGFKTSNSGTVTGVTTTTVAHGLAGTPTSVQITVQGATEITVGYNVDATLITLLHDSVGSITASWYAEYKP